MIIDGHKTYRTRAGAEARVIVAVTGAWGSGYEGFVDNTSVTWEKSGRARRAVGYFANIQDLDIVDITAEEFRVVAPGEGLISAEAFAVARRVEGRTELLCEGALPVWTKDPGNPYLRRFSVGSSRVASYRNAASVAKAAGSDAWVVLLRFVVEEAPEPSAREVALAKLTPEEVELLGLVP